MKTIGVFANCEKPSSARVLAHISEKAVNLGFQLITCDETADILPGSERMLPEKLGAEADMLIILGGDGTMLRIVRMLHGRDIPMLGVKLGGLGFLTSVSEDDIDLAMESLAKNDFSISMRSLAECVVIRSGNKKGCYRALNDIVIERGSSPRIVTLDILIDNKEVSSCMCDGLIVSTPTGSTGHSLSAGGPVLHPETEVFVISLICPHTLSTRPLVIPDNKEITVTVASSPDDVLLTVDGQVGEPVKQGDRINIRRSDQQAQFINLPGHSYFSVLRQKLHWRGSTI